MIKVIIGNKTSRVPTNSRFGFDAVLLKWSAGDYIDGIYQEGIQEATNIVLHKQPINDDDRQNLPEGERLREAIAIWVKTDNRSLIRPINQGNDNTRGDIIVLDNLQYEVYSVDNYSYNKHIYAICMRIENQSD